MERMKSAVSLCTIYNWFKVVLSHEWFMHRYLIQFSVLFYWRWVKISWFCIIFHSATMPLPLEHEKCAKLAKFLNSPNLLIPFALKPPSENPCKGWSSLSFPTSESPILFLFFMSRRFMVFNEFLIQFLAVHSTSSTRKVYEFSAFSGVEKKREFWVVFQRGRGTMMKGKMWKKINENQFRNFGKFNSCFSY